MNQIVWLKGFATKTPPSIKTVKKSGRKKIITWFVLASKMKTVIEPSSIFEELWEHFELEKTLSNSIFRQVYSLIERKELD